MKNQTRIALFSTAALIVAITLFISMKHFASTSSASQLNLPRTASYNSENPFTHGPPPLSPGDEISEIFDDRGSLAHALEYLNRAALTSPATPQ